MARLSLIRFTMKTDKTETGLCSPCSPALAAEHVTPSLVTFGDNGSNENLRNTTSLNVFQNFTITVFFLFVDVRKRQDVNLYLWVFPTDLPNHSLALIDFATWHMVNQFCTLSSMIPL